MHKIRNQLQQPQHGPVDVSSNTQCLKAFFYLFALIWCSSLCLCKHFTFPLLWSTLTTFFYSLLLCVNIHCSWFMSSASCDRDWIQRIRWIGMVRLFWQGKGEGVYWKIWICSVLIAVIAPALPFGEAAFCSCVSQTSFWTSPSSQCQLGIWYALHLPPEIRSQAYKIGQGTLLQHKAAITFSASIVLQHVPPAAQFGSWLPPALLNHHPLPCSPPDGSGYAL